MANSEWVMSLPLVVVETDVAVLDDAVDPTDMFDVMLAICTRCDPAAEIEFIRRTWSGPLDPILDTASSTDSRAVIDACRRFERHKDFPVVARAELKQWIAEKFADVLEMIGCR
jgi:3-polyprenyl-4-hydroxybenzoate decarboxylase